MKRRSFLQLTCLSGIACAVSRAAGNTVPAQEETPALEDTWERVPHSPVYRNRATGEIVPHGSHYGESMMTIEQWMAYEQNQVNRRLLHTLLRDRSLKP